MSFLRSHNGRIWDYRTADASGFRADGRHVLATLTTEYEPRYRVRVEVRMTALSYDRVRAERVGDQAYPWVCVTRIGYRDTMPEAERLAARWAR